MSRCFLLMLGGALFNLLLGDLTEGLSLAFASCVAVGLVIFQDARSGKALAALHALSAPQLRVLRDGVIKRVPASKLVPGDVVLLGEGDRVMANCVYFKSDSFSVDESARTGEAAPVTKHSASPRGKTSKRILSKARLNGVTSGGRTRARKTKKCCTKPTENRQGHLFSTGSQFRRSATSGSTL